MPAVAVIGCGNPLCGDDGVGPEVVRRLAARLPPGWVRCVDAGTGGVDAVLAMRGADTAILVDACSTGAAPGSLVELSAAAVAELPAPGGVDIHRLRWNQAVAWGRMWLAGECPARILVWLVEGERFEPGSGLSPRVAAGVERLLDRLMALLESHAPVG